MGLIYKPLGLILSLLAGLLGKMIFDFVWEKVDDQEPPEATTEETSWGRLGAVAAIQGVIFRVTRFAVDVWGAVGGAGSAGATSRGRGRGRSAPSPTEHEASLRQGRQRRFEGGEVPDQQEI